MMQVLSNNIISIICVLFFVLMSCDSNRNLTREELLEPICLSSISVRDLSSNNIFFDKEYNFYLKTYGDTILRFDIKDDKIFSQSITYKDKNIDISHLSPPFDEFNFKKRKEGEGYISSVWENDCEQVLIVVPNKYYQIIYIIH